MPKMDINKIKNPSLKDFVKCEINTPTPEQIKQNPDLKQLLLIKGMKDIENDIKKMSSLQQFIDKTYEWHTKIIKLP